MAGSETDKHDMFVHMTTTCDAQCGGMEECCCLGSPTAGEVIAAVRRGLEVGHSCCISTP